MNDEEEFAPTKMVIMCNHEDADSVMAALVMGAAAAATGEQVLMFFQPGGARALVKGELEKFQGIQGCPTRLVYMTRFRYWTAVSSSVN
jgi:predicted peroxiredoxin